MHHLPYELDHLLLIPQKNVNFCIHLNSKPAFDQNFVITNTRNAAHPFKSAIA